MSTGIINIEHRNSCPTAGPVRFPSSAGWYAAYTCARHEKWVAKLLRDRQIENFLPLYRSVHQWKDRRKMVELALFPSYVFVRIDPADRVRVLQVPGVVHLVSSQGMPVPLPTTEIEALKNGSLHQMHMEPCKVLHAGDRVRVIGGPLIGAHGVLDHFKGNVRVVVTLAALMRSVAVEVGAGDVEIFRP